MAPLDGLLVLDFTRAVSGPFCTMLLGDLGARIIKVEEPGHGDETRHWGPFHGAESIYYVAMNRNKESIAVNLKDPEGLRLVQAVAARADVVIENFRPGVAERLGIGYPALAAANPRLVYASVSGFGQTGPEQFRPGYDLIVQAMSGCMHVSGTDQQGPVKVAFPVSDIIAALFAGQAILAALYRRAQDGSGRYIEVSLLEGMLCAMSNLAAGYLITGREPRRIGVAQQSIVPYQLFHCKDAPVVGGTPNERLWERFCETLEHREWLEDPRFCGNAQRDRHRDVLIPLVEEVMRTRTAAEWLERFEQNGIPCGPVLTVAQALGLEQVAARGAVAEMNHETLGRVRVAANPMRFSGFEPEYRASPALGADTDRIRGEFLA